MRRGAEGLGETGPGRERRGGEHEGGGALGAGTAPLNVAWGRAAAAGGGSLHAAPACGLAPLLASSVVPRAMAPAGSRRATLGTGHRLPSCE